MTRIKERSTIQFNKTHVFRMCPLTFAMERIGSYWKPIILFNLLSGKKRYNELKKAMPEITEKMLIQELKQLEKDALISRKALPVVPPHVTYTLTDSGIALRPVIFAMAKWAYEQGKQNEEPLFGSMEEFPGGQIN